MHPSEEIYCEKSQRLRGKTIVIGMTGSIAVTECFSLIREMIKHGAKVIPVMTPSAAKLAAPDAIEFACGMKPIIELTGQCEHVKYLGGKVAAFEGVWGGRRLRRWARSCRGWRTCARWRRLAHPSRFRRRWCCRVRRR